MSFLVSDPELVTDFYLSAYLQQLKVEGYSLFVVRGVFPMVAGQDACLAGRGEWFDAQPIIDRKGKPSDRKLAQEAKERKELERAQLQETQQSLLDRQQAQAAAYGSYSGGFGNGFDRGFGDGFGDDFGGGYEDDPELALAMALSMQEEQKTRDKTDLKQPPDEGQAIVRPCPYPH